MTGGLQVLDQGRAYAIGPRAPFGGAITALSITGIRALSHSFVRKGHGAGRRRSSLAWRCTAVPCLRA